MRRIYSLRPSLALVAALIAVVPASAQSQLPRPGQLPPPGPPQAAPQRPGGPQAAPQQQQQPPAAPIKPYQPLAVTLPTPMTDPSFTRSANSSPRSRTARIAPGSPSWWSPRDSSGRARTATRPTRKSPASTISERPSAD